MPARRIDGQLNEIVKRFGMNQPQARRTGPLQRLGKEDLSVAGEILKAATQYLIPEDMTQRQAFGSYMPELYVLRNKGCSFAQIAELLKECGFSLQPSTVRIYYSEMLADRLDECQRRMNEQILLMGEVRKETHAVDSSTIAAQLAEINAQQRQNAAQKIERIFGVRAAENSTPPSAAARDPVRVVSKNDKIINDPLLTEEPAIPNLAAANNVSKANQASSASSQENSAASPHGGKPLVDLNLECLPVQPGIKPLQKKDSIPAHVYQPGDLDHPAIVGLKLNLEQRLCSVALQYRDLDSAEVHFETVQEKRFRVLWQKPLTMVPSSSSDTFVKMDQTLFKNS